MLLSAAIPTEAITSSFATITLASEYFQVAIEGNSGAMDDAAAEIEALRQWEAAWRPVMAEVQVAVAREIASVRIDEHGLELLPWSDGLSYNTDRAELERCLATAPKCMYPFRIYPSGGDRIEVRVVLAKAPADATLERVRSRLEQAAKPVFRGDRVLP